METIAKKFETVNIENELNLSDVQIEILVWLDAGYTQAEIAEYFDISQPAICKKLAQIKNKCDGRL